VYEEVTGQKHGPTDERMLLDLRMAITSRTRIEPEQDRLARLAAKEPDETRKAYLEFQRELVAKQLNRAADVAEARIQHYEKINTPELRELEMRRSAEDPVYWMRWWAWTMDPRADSPLNVVPMDPFPFQEEAVWWIHELIYDRRTDGLIEKSRDMGLTWLVLLYALHQWLYVDHFQALFGSYNEDIVDSQRKLDTMFEKVRFVLRRLPGWMLPEGFNARQDAAYMRIANPANGSTLTGSAPTANFGRGGRYALVCLDEHSAWPFQGRPQWTAASESCRTKLSFSTPRGKFNKQAELRFSGTIPVLTLKWTQHPWKDRRWYESLKLSLKQYEIAQEVDIDYEASQTGRLLDAYDEVYHVITWSEFAEMFGEDARDSYGRPQLPRSGYIGRAQDVGTTVGHPTATLWVWRPSEWMAWRECVFIYRELVRPKWPTEQNDEPVSIGGLARLIYEAERPWDERERVVMSLISHEQESARRTYAWDVPDQYKLIWTQWDVMRTAGIPQLQNYLAIDWTRPHPVRRYPKTYPDPALAGQPLFGMPRIFLVVADGQGELNHIGQQLVVKGAQNEAGLARLRAEIPLYHLPTDATGAEKRLPKPLFNDAVDALKALASRFFPPYEVLTEEERNMRAARKKYEHLTPEGLEGMDEQARSAALVTYMMRMQMELGKARSMTLTNHRLEG
jgi:hypothetical protein